MKRIFKNFICAALISATLFGFTACSENDGIKRAGESYGLVYNNTSLCRVMIETTGDNIESVEIDEVSLITDWARKSEIASGDVADEDWQPVTSGDTTVNYAKRVQFGDKIFVIGQDGKYAQTDGTQYSDWLDEQENAKFYWERMAAGDFFILDSDGEKYDVTYKPFAEGESTDKGKRFFKSQNGYWKEGGYGKGYKANMEALGEFITANGTGYDAADAKKNDRGNFELGGVDTGASVTSFKDYYALAQKAYDGRKEIPV